MKSVVTEVDTLYNHDEQKSISACTIHQTLKWLGYNRWAIMIPLLSAWEQGSKAIMGADSPKLDSWSPITWKMTRLFFPPSTVQVWWVCADDSLRFLFLGWKEGNHYSPSVIAQPPQGPMYCACWDAFLFNTVMKHDYRSYYIRSGSLIQLCHFPLSFLINKSFSPIELSFSVFASFSINSVHTDQNFRLMWTLTDAVVLYFVLFLINE